MALPESNFEFQPTLELRQTAGERIGLHGEWRLSFLVTNPGEHALELLSARLPHGQFRGEEQRFDPPLELAPGESILFDPQLRCDEPPGLVTENAFVIFVVSWMKEKWRVFVRIRVTIDDAGTPQTIAESVTTQKVGFSGIDN